MHITVFQVFDASGIKLSKEIKAKTSDEKRWKINHTCVLLSNRLWA